MFISDLNRYTVYIYIYMNIQCTESADYERFTDQLTKAGQKGKTGG